MAKRTVTVKLESPVEWFGKTLSEVTLREPTAGEFVDLGVIYLWGRTADGMEFATEKDSVIKAYLEKCLEVENGTAILNLLTVRDGQKIKAALAGFFTPPAAPEISKNESPNSPST